MEMMLRAGTASVPSSATGSGTVSPAVALSILGAERTGAGTTVCDSGTGLAFGAIARSLGSGFSIMSSQKIAARVRFGRIAIRIRIPISF